MGRTQKVDIRKRLGQTIRQFRLALGVTPKEFGDDIGKSQSFVIELESGEISADIVIIEKCANALSIDLTELFYALQTDAKPDLLLLSNASSSHGASWS